jgi:hypothetical protein
LTKAWSEYVEALGEGKVPEVESKYTNLVSPIVSDILKAQPEVLPDGAALD